MKFIWGCPTSSILVPFFSENFSRNHLDCGVATGYFPAVALDRPFRKDSKHHLTLLDLNPNPLNAARSRVLSKATATEVQCVEADVTEPTPESLKGSHFDSISMFNLFHCMPGGKNKFAAIANFKDLLSDDGVLAGCTVLGPKHSPSWLTTLYLKWYNWWGVFNNWDDTQEDIKAVLDETFAEVETYLVGVTLLFRAQKPRRTSGAKSSGLEDSTS